MSYQIKSFRFFVFNDSCFSPYINSLLEELHAKNPAPTEEDLAELGPPSRDLDAFSSTGISDPLLSVPTPQVSFGQRL